MEFENLVQLKINMDSNYRNSCSMAARNDSFFKKYQNAYTKSKLLFLKSGRVYYQNENLTLTQLLALYEEEYNRLFSLKSRC